MAHVVRPAYVVHVVVLIRYIAYRTRFCASKTSVVCARKDNERGFAYERKSKIKDPPEGWYATVDVGMLRSTV